MPDARKPRSRSQRNLPRTAWQPGQSGNPGGRPREVGHVRDLARNHTDAAIATLVTIMRDSKQPGRARVAAAEALLDRAWGRVPLSVEIDGDTPVQAVQIVLSVREPAEAEQIAPGTLFPYRYLRLAPPAALPTVERNGHGGAS